MKFYYFKDSLQMCPQIILSLYGSREWTKLLPIEVIKNWSYHSILDLAITQTMRHNNIHNIYNQESNQLNVYDNLLVHFYLHRTTNRLGEHKAWGCMDVSEIPNI